MPRPLRDDRRDDWIVRVPASSANLGSAFDAVALALDVHLEVTADADAAAPETHPAVRAFRHGGGVGPIAVRARFPGGRGLGFSGAARVGGLVAACAQQQRSSARLPARDPARWPASSKATPTTSRPRSTAESSPWPAVEAVRIPLPHELAVVVWIPDRETATPSARRLLAGTGPVRRRRVQHRPHRAARRGARRGRRRRAADRDRGPPAPGSPARPRPRHPARDRGRARRGRVRGVALGLRPVGGGAWSSPRARQEIAAAFPGPVATPVCSPSPSSAPP